MPTHEFRSVGVGPEAEWMALRVPARCRGMLRVRGGGRDRYL